MPHSLESIAATVASIEEKVDDLKVNMKQVQADVLEWKLYKAGKNGAAKVYSEQGRTAADRWNYLIYPMLAQLLIGAAGWAFLLVKVAK